MDNFKIALGVSRAQKMHKQHAQAKARPTMHCIRLVGLLDECNALWGLLDECNALWGKP